MKKLLFVLTILLINCISNISAQSIRHGSLHKMDNRNIAYFIGTDGKSAYQFRYEYKKKNGYIHKIDLKTQEETGTELVLGALLGDKDVNNIKIHTIKDMIYIFWVTYDKVADQGEVNCRLLNKNLKKVGNDAIVAAYDAKNTRQALMKGDYSVFFSRDSTEFLVSNTENLADKKSFDYEFSIYSLTLKSLFKTKFSLEVKDNNFYLQNILFSNSGKIFLMTTRYLDSKEKEKGEAVKTQVCYAIDAQTGKSKEINLDLPNKIVNNVKALIDKDDNLKCIGVYSDITKSGKATWGLQGVFFRKINSIDLSIDKATTTEFEPKLIALISGDKAAKKDRGAIDYMLKGIVERPNGGLYILLEEQWMHSVTTTSTNSQGHTTTRTTYYYHADDVTVIAYNALGKIEWFATHEKSQTFVNDSYSRSLAFYFACQKDNLTLTYFEQAEKGIWDNNIVVVNINSAGKINTSKLDLNEGLEKGTITTRGIATNFLKVSENELLTETRIGKKPNCCCLLMNSKSLSYRYSTIKTK